MTAYLTPYAEQNSAGEWVAWLHDGPTLGVFPTEAEALDAIDAHRERQA